MWHTAKDQRIHQPKWREQNNKSKDESLNNLSNNKVFGDGAISESTAMWNEKGPGKN